MLDLVIQGIGNVFSSFCLFLMIFNSKNKYTIDLLKHQIC